MRSPGGARGIGPARRRGVIAGGLWMGRGLPSIVHSVSGGRRHRGELESWLTCLTDTPPTCAWERPAKCTNPVRPNGKFCAEHTCQAVECLEGKDQQVVRATACAEHRCTATDLCGGVRAPLALGAGNYLFGGDTTFCREHACHHRGCMSEAVERTHYCRRHLCAVQDCRQEARFHGKKLCAEHAEAREDSIRTGANRPRGAPPIAPVYGPPPPPPLPYPPVLVDGSGVYGYPVPPVVPGVMPPDSYSYSHGPGHQGGGYYF
ncbi:hypothetical protein GE09DRAFT_1072722 [Coniochaeta sp. 2T2.1]|nr:hypothetical protein GE09DRAFT_1072722 [Coniochaeta sp. 2T2.1]